MDVTASSSNSNTSDTNGNIKVEIEIKIEPKHEPDINNENVRSFVSSQTPRLGRDYAVAFGDTVEETGETDRVARVEFGDAISTRELEEGQTRSKRYGVAFQSQPVLMVQIPE